MADEGKKSARDVIDLAIKENRRVERLFYYLAIAFTTSGLTTLILGALFDNAYITVAGCVVSFIAWPMISHARKIRQENIAIRLLEIPLLRASTAAEAARALQDGFAQLFAAKDP